MPLIIGGLAAGIGGSIIQGRAGKKAARRANRLSPAQIAISQRAERVSGATEAAFLPFLSGKFDAKRARETREDTRFLASFAKEQAKEALQSNLSFLAGTGLLKSGRAAQLQARGAAEIARIGEFTARQRIQQEEDRRFNRQQAAASILSQFIAPGQAIANRPRTVATDTTGQAIAGLGGQLTGLGIQGLLGGSGGFGGGAQVGPGVISDPRGGQSAASAGF